MIYAKLVKNIIQINSVANNVLRKRTRQDTNPRRESITVSVENDGSQNAYVVNGVRRKRLVFESGVTYYFEAPSGHPVRLSTTADGGHGGGAEYEDTGNYFYGGGHSEFTITDSTPTKLFYQCGNHAKMGIYAFIEGYANIKDNDLIISVDLLDEFTQFIIFDASGPLFIKRLASIKNYPSIDDMKKINEKDIKKNNSSKMPKNLETYNSLSKLDLKILIREIDTSFNNFLNKNNLNKKAKIFLSGRNSQHKNLVNILGPSLMMDVAVISPIHNYLLKEFSYNPDEINYFRKECFYGFISQSDRLSINSIPATKSPEVIPVAQKIESPVTISSNSYFFIKSFIPIFFALSLSSSVLNKNLP